MRLGLSTFILAALLVLARAESDQDQGTLRLERLRERSLLSSNRIISFSKTDFEQYVMKYPRPYDVVIYFTARTCKFCDELYPEYEYLVKLYKDMGAIDQDTYPTFFAQMTYHSDIVNIFEMFGFKGAPNLVVSKPHMAVVSDIEKKMYLQGFKWSISHTDGHVTTHKMLDFVNKRTGKDVFYKPPLTTMFQMFFGFIAVALIGVYVYARMKFLWNHWVFWLVGSLIVYITCCSGIVYDIIHDVPMTGRDQKTGETIIFSGGNREQYGLEGWIVSISITLVGLLFIAVIVFSEKSSQKYSIVFGGVAIYLIYFIVTQLELIYKDKGWYGPRMRPPDGYIAGPLSRDQGNNI